MLTCTLLKASDLSDRDIALWRDMAAQTHAFASPILSPDFVQAVARVRNDVYVAIYRQGADIIGFLAHHRRPNRFARPAGAPFADYTSLITFPDPPITMAQALTLAGIDRLHAAGVVDPYGVFGDHGGTPDDAYAIDIRAEDPVNNVPKKHAKNINRLRRQLTESLGEPHFVIGDLNLRHFDAMLALKRAQVIETGLHDFLAAPWVQRMMRDLFEAPQDGLHGCLVTLMAGDTPLKYQFGPRLGHRAHPWVSSYDPAFGAFSPGQIFLNDCRLPLKAAGVEWYDLSTGQQHYKPAFSNSHIVVHNATLFGASPAARVKSGFLRVAKRLQKALGPVDHVLDRVDRRMDVIASLELDTVTRVRGLAYALTTAPRRWGGKRGGTSDHG